MTSLSKTFPALAHPSPPTPSLSLTHLLLFVGLFWAVVLLMPGAAYANVTITLSGTVSSGTDTSGVFGAPASSLASKSFTLTYSFDPTKGAPTQGCTYASGCGSQLTGLGTSSPATATLSIGTGSFDFGTNSSDSSNQSFVTQSVLGSAYSSDLWVSDYGANDVVYMALSGTGTSSFDFDWRTAFNSVYAGATSPTASFSINSASGDIATGNLTITAISESGAPTCSSTPTITIDTSSSGHQPNILNPADTTSLAIALPSVTTWFPVTLTYSSGGAHVTNPLFRQATDTSGHAAVVYKSAGDNVVDSVTTSGCGTTSGAISVFDFKTYLDSGATTLFNIHQSQVSDSAYLNYAALNYAQIYTFFENVTTAPTFMAQFYWTYVGPGVEAGFTDVNGDGYYYHADDGNPYCSDGSTTCVTDGTPTTSGTLASYAISLIAGYYGVNPELVLTKMQVEKSLNSATTMPGYATLNHATGCGASSTLFQQLECAASTYSTLYYSTPSEPYFWPVDAAHVNQSIQYAYSGSANCIDGTLTTDCALVGFSVTNGATFAQYKYTPFVQTTTGSSSGGVRLFETIWYKYASNNWYH